MIGIPQSAWYFFRVSFPQCCSFKYPPTEKTSTNRTPAQHAQVHKSSFGAVRGSFSLAATIFVLSRALFRLSTAATREQEKRVDVRHYIILYICVTLLSFARARETFIRCREGPPSCVCYEMPTRACLPCPPKPTKTYNTRTTWKCVEAYANKQRVKVFNSAYVRYEHFAETTRPIACQATRTTDADADAPTQRELSCEICATREVHSQFARGSQAGGDGLHYYYARVQLEHRYTCAGRRMAPNEHRPIASRKCPASGRSSSTTTTVTSVRIQRYLRGKRGGHFAVCVCVFGEWLCVVSRIYWLTRNLMGIPGSKALFYRTGSPHHVPVLALVPLSSGRSLVGFSVIVVAPREREREPEEPEHYIAFICM